MSSVCFFETLLNDLVTILSYAILINLKTNLNTFQVFFTKYRTFNWKLETKLSISQQNLSVVLCWKIWLELVHDRAFKLSCHTKTVFSKRTSPYHSVIIHWKRLTIWKIPEAVKIKIMKTKHSVGNWRMKKKEKKWKFLLVLHFISTLIPRVTVFQSFCYHPFLLQLLRIWMSQ